MWFGGAYREIGAAQNGLGVPTTSTLGLTLQSQHFHYIFGAAILKIQDGCKLQTISMGTTGLLMSENIS